jgi:hypothetical protein
MKLTTTNYAIIYVIFRIWIQKNPGNLITRVLSIFFRTLLQYKIYGESKLDFYSFPPLFSG